MEEIAINPFKIRVIDPNNDTISGELGISEERLEVLKKHLHTTFMAIAIRARKESEGVSSLGKLSSDCTSICENVNEVCFVMYQVTLFVKGML